MHCICCFIERIDALYMLFHRELMHCIILCCFIGRIDALYNVMLFHREN